MSWFISFMLAGMMFTSQSGFSALTSETAINGYVPQYVIAAPQVVLLDETERFEQTYPLNSDGKVSVSNINGSITVETWDKNEVKVEAIKTADTRENLGDVRIKIDSKPEYLKIETEYEAWKNKADGNWKNRKLEVQYRLWVPRNAMLDEIATVNGSINASNLANSTKISTVNGLVKAVNLRGSTKIETVNGTIMADFENLQNVSEVSLGVVNGTANLTLPSDSDATIKAESVNGVINNDFGLPVRKGKYVGRDLYGKIGSGNVRINLEAVNGSMNIRRRQDGKNLSPATNLLPAISEDETASAAASAKATRNVRQAESAKINAEVAKAMKNASADMEKALIEMEKIQPELQKATLEALNESMKGISAAMRQPVISGAMRVKINEDTKRRLEELKQRGIFLRGSALPVVEKKTETFTVKGTPRVNVNAQNCKVFVRGWDKSEVQYSVIKLSHEGSQSPLQYKGEQKGSDITIEVAENTEDGDAFDTNQVRVEVFVPKKSNLRILTSKEIRVEGVTGEVNLVGANEPVNVRDVAGKLSVETDDGAIRIIGFAGGLRAKTVEGLMSLEGDFQDLTVDSVSGDVILTLVDGTNATVTSNVEEIKAQGISMVRDSSDESIWQIGKGGLAYTVNTADGSIVIRNAASLIAAN